ncbi:hypothetical protein [Stenoxybacter acetivorans]|uniref:hypothetical protein n=1 Tax=Stenoxybacter acetivorans TaxID=422441 RepID=UPI000569F9F6|nr:hypothetical protein [Stenoxybacter acetivorans]
MRKPRHPLANWFSFNQHRKRFGAVAVSAALEGVDLAQMKHSIITEGDAAYTHGSKKELAAHLADLRKEFSGQSELTYYHAQLIVLIRRGADTAKHFVAFETLWAAERDFLLNALSTRWLIAAADTFIDHSRDAVLPALLMNAVILINTIKLQESERYLYAAENAAISPERKASLQNERLALFDGVSGFAVGTDDTLRNMRWRLDKICAAHPMGALVTEVFKRVQYEGNVYARFKKLHTREKTVWWS